MPSVWRAALANCFVESFCLSRYVFPERSFALILSLLFTIHILLLAVWKIVLWPLAFSPLRHLPEPSGASTFNGHASMIPDERSGFPMSYWINEIPNNGLIRYRVKFNKERVFVTSPKALSEVLVQKNYDFAKPYTLRLGLGRILGVGLIIAEGDEHKRQRRKLMPAFAHRHIKDLYPVFWSKSMELAKVLSSQVAGNTTVIDIPNWLNRTTLDIIGVAGMGQTFDTIHNPENEICNAYQSVFDAPPPKSKLVILKMLAQEILARLFSVKRNDSIAVASETLKQVGRRIIQQKQQGMDAEGKLVEKDIISVALQSGGFTDEMLVNQIMTFLAAGHETTATSMTWALLALSEHPDVQTKLREEVRTRLPKGNDTESGPMTPELIDSLPYLHAVCNEVLRVYPPAGLTKRVAVKDTSILGQHIPAGTDIVVIMRAINHSKELWGEDATTFNPERWLGPGRANSGGATSNFAFCTFLHGPRSCIGQGFAKAEFASLLAVLVGAFEMELEDENRPIEIETGLTSKPKGGLRLRMRRVPGW